MSIQIVSTVEKLPEEQDKAGAKGGQKVIAKVLDAEETAKLEALRAAIAHAETTEEVDSHEAIAELHRYLLERDR